MKDVIIFSSKESYSLAEKIKDLFWEKKIQCTLWGDGFFQPSRYTLENFNNLASDYHNAIVILGADDRVISRGKKKMAPRDNVILELGICVGQLGLEHTFFVHPDGIKIPSDLWGITSIIFPKEFSDENDIANYVVSGLKKYIKAEVNNQIINRMIMWEEYSFLTRQLLSVLKRTVNLGGYYFDVILSVSRGGNILANMISRTYGQNMPVLYFQEDRRDGNGTYDTVEVGEINQEVLNIIRKRGYKYALVVDSAVRTGVTLQRAKRFLKKELGDGIRVKTAVLLIDCNIKGNIQVDYYAQKTDTKGLGFFYNEFD